MKQYLLLSIACMLLGVENYAQAGKDFTISGVIKNSGNTKVLLGNKPDGYPSGFEIIYFDSCISRNDSFYFKGHIKEPAFYSIEIPGKSKGWCTFVLDDQAISIEGNKDSLWKAVVTGSEQNDRYFSYKKLIDQPVQRHIKEILSRVKELDAQKDSLNSNELKKDSLAYYSNLVQKNLFNYITLHPSDYVSLYRLFYLYPQISIDTARKYYSLLSESLKDNSMGKNLYYNLYELPENIKALKKVPDFSLPDTSGQPINISFFRGKYVIIDFWASWCGPCIAEFPGLKKVYSTFSGKKLIIAGISLDTDKQSWIKAIKENELDWYHLSDLHGNNNNAALLFGVESIPQKFLINPDGVILLMNSSISEIEEELNRLLNKNL